MSKKTFKSQASSSRAFTGNPLTGPIANIGFGVSTTSSFAQGPGSALSYVYEPPDLSSISDPAIGVSFKNLQKKDSTTKYKALEDLHTHVTAQENDKAALEDPFLEAWIKLFPRTAIDNSNRVRQSSYSLHGRIVAFCGKRFIKHMPSTVGAWLAGGFDRDRQVSRAARESLESTFPTEDKRTGVWKAFQGPILDYCLAAIQNETIQSLSDERTCSPDDAEAKYARAISGALLTITGLLDTLPENELHKHAEAYEQYLRSDTVWKLASSKDGVLRKAIYHLSVSSTEKIRDLVDIPKFGNVLIRQLSADQSGSAYELVNALAYFTKLEPQIWTTFYDGSAKKSSATRLSSFLSKGSHGLGTQYYKELSVLLDSVPIEILLLESTGSAKLPSKLLSNLRDGITSSNVERRDTELHAVEGWQCFLKIADRVLANLRDPEVSQAVIDDGILTIILHYVDPGLVEWGRNWPDRQDIASKACSIAMKYSPESTMKSIDSMSKCLIQNMQISLPEQSKDFAKSQESIIVSFTRWYDLQTSILCETPKLLETFTTTASSEAQSAIELLKARNSKPYGAAKALELLVTKLPETSLRQPWLLEILQTFAKEVIPRSMQSPSAQAYLKLLDAIGSSDEIAAVLDSAVTNLLAAPSSASRSTAIELLIKVHWPSISQSSDKLVQTILDDLDLAMTGETSAWQLPFAVFDSSRAPKDLNDQILNRMFEGLSIDSKLGPTIRGFNELINRDIRVLQTFVNSPRGQDLLSKLLYLSQLRDESIRSLSIIMRDTITTMISGGQGNPIVSIIRDNVLVANQSALPISTLWMQTETYLKRLSDDQLSATARSLIPDISLWQESLQPFLDQAINPVITFMDPFGDAVHLVTPPTHPSTVNTPSYDEEGYSPPLRAALFVTKLLTMVKEAFVDAELAGPLCNLLMLVNLLISDSVGLACNMSIYNVHVEHDETTIIETLSELQRVIVSWMTDAVQSDDSVLLSTLRDLLHNAQGTGSSSYYHARAFVAFVRQFEGSQGFPNELIPDQGVFTRLRKNPQLFTDLAIMIADPQAKGIVKLFNEIISDFSLSKTMERHDSLRQLVTLNILLRNNDLEVDAIPKQRLVYFVKSCVSFLDDGPTVALRVEILRALETTVSALVDIYDDFWESIIQQAILAMNNNDLAQLTTVHASLRLFAVLKQMLRREPNEDLQEAWTKLEPDINQSCLDFLQAQAHTSSTSQASRIVYELLYRQILNSSFIVGPALVDLYPVLDSQSTVLQRIAYQILEKTINKAQEQVSLNAALTADFVPKLPSELLAIAHESPEEDEYQELKTKSELPSSLSRYLFAWKLIFQHWNKASYKVRAAYVTSLKDSACVDGLLSLTFITLIEHHGGKGKAGFDPSRIPPITTYYTDNVEDPETEFIWLICNIYYNLLLHAPHLAKSWYTNSCPRALKSSVETWTSRYISPLVISAELDIVSEWKPPTEDSNSELTIKVYPKASEVIASLPLDETFVAIKVHLPASYPLVPINLSTVQRMGIDEKKWQAFLNVSLIVMNFSSTSRGLGATIDGISAWRNNVIGALKGHNECAICYSVVAEDGKVPTKKCATCGHLFHGLCLYKWFQRSAASSCPLCRNAFNYA